MIVCYRPMTRYRGKAMQTMMDDAASAAAVQTALLSMGFGIPIGLIVWKRDSIARGAMRKLKSALRLFAKIS